MESATLDLPGIDESMLTTTAAPAAPKTELATAAAGAIDLRKIDLEAVALAHFGDWKERAADVNARHGKTIFQALETTKGFDALKKALAETKQVRFDGQNVADELKSKMAKVSKAVGAKRDEISASVADTEKSLQAQVDDETTRRNEAKRIAEEKAAARRQEFEEKVAGIRKYLALAQGLPSARIEKGIAYLVANPIGDGWEEFKPIAEKAYDETLASLRELLAKTQAAEIEAAERERVKAENERLRAENERIQAELTAQRAELQRQADELAARERATAQPPEAPKGEPRDAEPEKVAPRPAEPAPISTAVAVEAMNAALAADPELEDKVMADRLITGTGWVRVAADPATPSGVSVEHVPMGDVLAFDDYTTRTPDRTGSLLLLLAHIAKAFDTKFPTQPKPPVEWWAELKRLAAEVSA